MILELLGQELEHERPRLRAVHAAWSNQAGAPTEALYDGLAELIDFLARFDQAAASCGLAGLSDYLSLVRELVQTSVLAASDTAPGNATQTDRVVALGVWMDQTRDYLLAPGHVPTVEAMAALLLAEPGGIDAHTVQSAVDHLLVPELPGDTAATDSVHPVQEDDGNFSLAITDVEADQLAAFLAEAPRQNGLLEAAVVAWSEGIASPAMVQDALRAAHTLKGSGYILGLNGIGKLAHRLEDMLEMALSDAARSRAPDALLVQDVMESVFCLQQMVGFLQGAEDAPDNAAVIAQRLMDWTHWLADQSGTGQPAPAPDFTSTRLTTTTGAAAPVPSPAPVLASLQIGSTQLDRLLRSSGQFVMKNERASQLISDTDTWLAEIENTNRLLIQGFQELESLMGLQRFQLPAEPTATEGFDALELERFNTIQTMARSLDEKVHDNMALLGRVRGMADQSANLLREERYALIGQRNDLLALRTTEVRTIASRLKRTVHQTAIAAGRKVSLEVSGEDVRMDVDVLQRLVEPLLHLLRNAVDHGIEPAAERTIADKPEAGAIRVDFSRDSQHVAIRIMDDGRGLDLSAIARKAVALGLLAADATPTEAQLQRLILEPGFSTRDTVTATSGRGIGLDIVNDRILQLSGQIEIDSVEGFGCHITLLLPAVSGARHALLVRCGGHAYALPSQNVQTIVPAGAAALTRTAKGLEMQFDESTFRVQSLYEWLHLPEPDGRAMHDYAAQCVTIVLRGVGDHTALLVDSALDFRELMVQDVGRLTRSLGGIQGASLLADGSPIYLLDLPALARTAGQQRRVRMPVLTAAMHRAPVILVVDDSWTTRLAMKQLLEDAGYRVATASDGNLALDSIRQSIPDLVITDLEMPHLNGLELTRRLREYPLWTAIPLLMLTSRSAEKHKAQAVQAGISLYLTKPYQDHELLRSVRELLLPTPHSSDRAEALPVSAMAQPHSPIALAL